MTIPGDFKHYNHWSGLTVAELLGWESSSASRPPPPPPPPPQRTVKLEPTTVQENDFANALEAQTPVTTSYAPNPIPAPVAVDVGGDDVNYAGDSDDTREQLSKRIQCVITIVVVGIFILIGGSEVEGQ